MQIVMYQFGHRSGHATVTACTQEILAMETVDDDKKRIGEGGWVAFRLISFRLIPFRLIFF